MTKNTVKNVEMISNEELYKITGGTTIGCPLFAPPGMGQPIRREKEEPKDGGATGGW